MPNPSRPLSPHLSIYRWPITMALSILHRASGLANAVGLVVLTVWLIRAADGPDAYLAFTRVMGSPIGMLVLIGLSLSFFYHLSNGIRHLFWDVGYGFEKHQATRSAWAVLVVSVVLTAAFWLVMS